MQGQNDEQKEKDADAEEGDDDMLDDEALEDVSLKAATLVAEITDGQTERELSPPRMHRSAGSSNGAERLRRAGNSR